MLLLLVDLLGNLALALLAIPGILSFFGSSVSRLFTPAM